MRMTWERFFLLLTALMLLALILSTLVVHIPFGDGTH